MSRRTCTGDMMESKFMRARKSVIDREKIGSTIMAGELTNYNPEKFDLIVFTRSSTNAAIKYLQEKKIPFLYVESKKFILIRRENLLELRMKFETDELAQSVFVKNNSNYTN